MTSSSKAGNTQRRGDIRRERLKQATTQLLTESTFDSITYQDIAKRADLPLASCYHFYPNKLALVRSIADEMTSDYLASVFNLRLYQDSDTLGTLLERWVELGVEHHMKSVAELEIFFGPDIPMSVRNDSLEREKIIAVKLAELIDGRLGTVPLEDLSSVLYYAIELARTCLALNYQEHGKIMPEGIRRAKTAVVAYTLAHL